MNEISTVGDVAYRFKRGSNAVEFLVHVRAVPRARRGGLILDLVDQRIVLREKVNLLGYNARPKMVLKVWAEVPKTCYGAVRRNYALQRARSGQPILK